MDGRPGRVGISCSTMVLMWQRVAVRTALARVAINHWPAAQFCNWRGVTCTARQVCFCKSNQT
ncbi:MAG: hypothetical protein DCC52_09335 [Chloroflexi bacterium]|nr:MAG: hypothetical protein DCC52_09335 [Chloroflexota bacterium]